jgi:hypothetical protein
LKAITDGLLGGINGLFRHSLDKFSLHPLEMHQSFQEDAGYGSKWSG